MSTRRAAWTRSSNVRRLFDRYGALTVEVAFKVYDLDGNGFIERHELLKLAEAIHKFVDLSQQHAPKQGEHVSVFLDVS